MNEPIEGEYIPKNEELSYVELADIARKYSNSRYGNLQIIEAENSQQTIPEFLNALYGNGIPTYKEKPPENWQHWAIQHPLEAQELFWAQQRKAEQEYERQNPSSLKRKVQKFFDKCYWNLMGY